MYSGHSSMYFEVCMEIDLKRSNIPVTSIRGDRKVTRTVDLQDAIDGVVSQHSKKHWRTIAQEFGERNIKLSDLADTKCLPKELAVMLDDDIMTLSDLVILAQYSRAIVDRDTKAATFLRDTAGYQPPKEVKVENTPTGLSTLTEDELHQLLIALNNGEE